MNVLFELSDRTVPAVQSSGDTPPDQDDRQLRWYACYTRARAEKRVERQLLERDVEAWLPVAERERIWADRRKVVRFPLFPGYVFGRFALNGLHGVLSVPGVATIVRLNGRPAPIRDEEIDNIRRMVDGLAVTRQEPELRRFCEGDWVRVADGPFAGLEGVVLELRGRRHVLAGLRALGQGLSICIEGARLTRIRRSRAANY